MGFDEEASNDETITDEPFAEEPGAEQMSADEESFDEAATDEAATDEESTDEEATDEAATDEAATEEAATDEEATDEDATDEDATDEAATDAERPAVIIKAAGDSIQSGDITVGGKHFVDWFNEDLRPAHPGKHPTARPHGYPIDHFGADVNKAGFIETFNHTALLYGPRLGFHQFIGMFCIFYNETGGRLRSVSEGDYLPTVERRLRAAMRYNRAPNVAAGKQLAERGLLHDQADIAAWSGTSYVGPSENEADPDRRALFEAAQECDFYKYRGRGLNQLTWRPYITMILDPLLAAAGYGKTCDQLTERELTRAVETDPRIAYGMSRSYFTRREFLGGKFAALDQDTPDWTAVGMAVSGDRTAHGYAEIYAWRCETLRAAMNDAGWQAD